MNPNLTPAQRAARNLFASQSSTADSAIIELAFLNPSVGKLAGEMVTGILSGPYGNFTLVAAEADHTVTSPNHEEGYREGHAAGFLAALTQVNEVIDDLIQKLPLDGGQVALEALTALKGEVAEGIESVTPAQNSTGVEALSDLLEALFGRKIQVYQLG